jgi:hypothetical protein
MHLVRVIPSCFRFAKMCFSFLGELHVVYTERGACFSSCGEFDVDRLGSISFYSQFLNKFWIPQVKRRMRDTYASILNYSPIYGKAVQTVSFPDSL